MKYAIGGREFRTKQDIIFHLRLLMNKYPKNTPIPSPDHDFLIALLNRHRWAKEKIGVGINSFCVRENLIYKNKGFWILRKDYSLTDFSFYECIYTPKDWKLYDLKAACRNSISWIMIWFKNTHLPSECPITGIKLTQENSHVDHEEPQFNKIVTDWLKKNNLQVENIELVGYEDGSVQKHFKSEEIEQSFVSYHNSLAKLRLIHKSANLKRSKKGN